MANGWTACPEVPRLERPRVENADVRWVEQAETVAGPVAIDGRTLTLVARTSIVRLGRRPGLALGGWARPAHVEVLDRDGRRRVVRIHDVEAILTAAIALTGATYVLAARAIKRARRP